MSLFENKFNPVFVTEIISHHKNLISEIEQLERDLRTLRGNGSDWRNRIELDPRKSVQLTFEELKRLEKEIKDFNDTTVVPCSPVLERCTEEEDLF